jgi:hypothetical protein
MSITLTPEVKAKIIERAEPHCIAWINATASLWGNVKWHDLDEPMPLTNEVPVRLRYVGHRVITDNPFTLKVTQAGHHVALRFKFKSGYFFEVDVPGISEVSALDQTTEVNIC